MLPRYLENKDYSYEVQTMIDNTLIQMGATTEYERQLQRREQWKLI